MFQAYPQQHHPRWRWKVLILLCVTSVLYIIIYVSMSLSSRSLKSGEITDLQIVQPFLSSQGYEFGIWTRQQGLRSEKDAIAKSEAEPVHSRPALDTTAASEDPAIANRALQGELEAERARTAAQELEIQRLRDQMAVHIAAQDAIRNSAEESTDAESPPILATTQSPTTTTTSTSTPFIPESLWRQPPSDDDVSNRSPAELATTTTSTSTSSTSFTSTSAPQSPLAMAQSQGQGQPRITVEAGGNNIVVQIDQTDRTAPLPPPAQFAGQDAQSAKQDALAPQQPQQISGSSLPPAEPAATVAGATAVLPAPLAPASPGPAPRQGEEGRSITVKTGGQEIIVQIGTGHSESTAEVPESSRTSTTSTSTTTSAAPVPVAQSPMSAISVATTLTSTKVNSVEVTDQQPESAKVSHGTQITVKAQGQSITIEIPPAKSDEQKPPDHPITFTTVQPSTLPGPTTTPPPPPTVPPSTTQTTTTTTTMLTIGPLAPSAPLPIRTLPPPANHSDSLVTLEILGLPPPSTSTLAPALVPNTRNVAGEEDNSASSNFANLAMRAR